MNKKNILITIKKELLTIIRDKKTFIIIMLSPLIIPAIFILMGTIENTILNSDNYLIGIDYELTIAEKALLKEYPLEVIQYENANILEEKFQNDEINAYITKNDKEYIIHSNIKSNDNAYASEYAKDYLMQYNNVLANQYLIENNIDPSKVFEAITIKEDNEIEENENMILNTIISIAIAYINIIIVLTAANCASPSTAGEKENGTMETILTFPIRSSELITGKFLATFICAFINALISFILLVLCILILPKYFIMFEGGKVYMGLTTIITYLTIFTMFALFISGLAIAMASKAKTIREANSSLNSLSYVTLIPSFLSMGGFTNNLLISFIPIFNYHFILNDALFGKINYLQLFIMVISSITYIAILIYIISKQYKSEKILFN